MAVIVTTPRPKALKARIVSDINDGTLETWEFEKAEKYFTHKAKQWHGKAWFKMTAGEGELVFNIVRPGNQDIDTDIYAEYHGFLVRMLLAHYDTSFSDAMSTAMPAVGDIVSQPKTGT